MRALRRSLLLASLPLAGCMVFTSSVSLSDSSASASKAIGGSVESLSDSSTSAVGAQAASYARDLREYVASFARARGRPADFARGVSRIAVEHGISNWESHEATAGAIGQGLRAANLNEAQVNAFCADTALAPALAQGVAQAWKRTAG